MAGQGMKPGWGALQSSAMNQVTIGNSWEQGLLPQSPFWTGEMRKGPILPPFPTLRGRQVTVGGESLPGTSEEAASQVTVLSQRQ